MADSGELEKLKNQLLAAGPLAFSPGQQRDVAQHLERLEKEFSGRPPRLFHHALLIVSIRRRIELEAALSEFFRLWEAEKEFLLRELDLRWLKSACDTLADHGRTPAQRALAVATSMLVNLVKVYETERQLGGGPGTRTPGIQDGPQALFDGVRSFKIGWGDMVRNMAERIHATSALDELAGSILTEVFRRMHQNDTVLRRFLEKNRKPELAWAVLPPREPGLSVPEDSRTPGVEASIIYGAQGTEMSLAQLVEHAAQNHPNVLAGIPEGKALPFVRAVFRDVVRAIDATEEGIVKLGGLGDFRIRQVEREVDGEKVVRKHVVFRPGT